MMILQNKNAVIYGAGGSLGGAVARALAAAGAYVFLTGRSAHSVQQTAERIIEAGGNASVDIVDAFNEEAVQQHLQKVIQKAGKVDISFNAVGVDVKQNVPLTTLSVDDFVLPVTLTLQTRFLTAKAAAIVMMKQRSGVILSLTATPGGIGYPYTGGFAAACCAVESFSRNLASETGAYGIRVVNIRSGGSPDSNVFMEAMNSFPEAMKPIIQKMEGDTMLKRLPPMSDIANAAVFLVSDMAASITGVTVDVTGGTTAALNYRVDLETFSRME
jgi:NAD(P)-dependent dehydrogenase (short-subunit alcohol dehydrogenase family)